LLPTAIVFPSLAQEILMFSPLVEMLDTDLPMRASQMRTVLSPEAEA